MTTALSNSSSGYGLSRTKIHWIEIDQLADGVTPPTPVQITHFRGYEYTIGDDSIFTVQVPPDYMAGTNMYMKIRWSCPEDYVVQTGSARWRCTYMACDEDRIVPIGNAGVYFCTNDIAIPTLASQMREDTVALIPGSVGSDEVFIDAFRTLSVEITRMALETGTNPATEPAIYGIFLEYTAFTNRGMVA